MGTMKSMKFTKGEAKKAESPEITGYSGQHFPWGLSITLNAAALKKLGIDEELPDAGDECQIMARGKVTTVSQSAGEKYEDRRVEIQITHLDLVAKDTDDESWAKVKKDRKEA